MTVARRRFSYTRSPQERLADDIALLREQAKNMKPGVALDQVLRRIRQNETASHMSEWLSSPGLQTPK
jgi:hypothetical protein